MQLSEKDKQIFHDISLYNDDDEFYRIFDGISKEAKSKPAELIDFLKQVDLLQCHPIAIDFLWDRVLEKVQFIEQMKDVGALFLGRFSLMHWLKAIIAIISKSECSTSPLTWIMENVESAKEHCLSVAAHIAVVGALEHLEIMIQNGLSSKNFPFLLKLAALNPNPSIFIFLYEKLGGLPEASFALCLAVICKNFSAFPELVEKGMLSVNYGHSDDPLETQQAKAEFQTVLNMAQRHLGPKHRVSFILETFYNHGSPNFIDRYRCKRYAKDITKGEYRAVCKTKWLGNIRSAVERSKLLMMRHGFYDKFPIFESQVLKTLQLVSEIPTPK